MRLQNVKKTPFGKWCKTQKEPELIQYFWSTMLYGPPDSFVWTILETFDKEGGNKISEWTVKRVVRALTRKDVNA